MKLQDFLFMLIFCSILLGVGWRLLPDAKEQNSIVQCADPEKE